MTPEANATGIDRPRRWRERWGGSDGDWQAEERRYDAVEGRRDEDYPKDIAKRGRWGADWRIADDAAATRIGIVLGHLDHDRIHAGAPMSEGLSCGTGMKTGIVKVFDIKGQTNCGKGTVRW